jgi:hypothetical protein
VVDGREPARLVRLLEHGSTEGTLVTPEPATADR